MGYYSTNAIYQRLDVDPSPQLVWVSGGAWILVYADASACAKAIVFVEGDSMRMVARSESDRVTRANNLACSLAADAHVPFATIQFDDLSPEIDKVTLEGQRISLSELKEWFASVGLPVSLGGPQKAINSKESSAYHNWQRSNLGAIKVSDVDLIRLRSDDQSPVEVIELKRSFYPLSRWRPYPQDYPNFNLLADVAGRVGARFTIAYNRRETSPSFFDDASRLSLFSYSKHGSAQPLGEFSFEQFASGTYLSRERSDE